MRRDGLIGIVRLCVRCRTWRSVDNFTELGKVCRPCTNPNKATHGRAGALTRALALTDKGRAALREIGVAA